MFRRCARLGIRQPGGFPPRIFFAQLLAHLLKIAAGGTAITTLGPLITMSTNAAGFTTNVLQTGAIVAGDDVYVQAGADATGVWTIGLELVITPGASVSP